MCRTLRTARLLSDQVDQPVGYEDGALHPAVADRSLDVGAAQRPPLRFFLLDAGRHLDAVAQPPIDLHHDRDLRPTQHGFVRFGPRLEDEQPLAALPVPELLGEVRRKGAEQPGQVAAYRLPRLIASAAGL